MYPTTSCIFVNKTMLYEILKKYTISFALCDSIYMVSGIRDNPPPSYHGRSNF